MDIEAGQVPQPTNINVGFTDTDPDEAEIEKQILEAEAKGTSIGEIEDAKLKVAPEKTDEEKVDEEKEAKDAVEGKPPDNSETPAEKETREAQERDEKGRFKKDESKFEKAKKDAARKDTSWKALNEEKAQVRAEAERTKAELEQRAQEIASERARMQEQARNRGEFSPQEYHKASQDWNKAAFNALSEGDTEKAQEMFKNASQCSLAAQRTWEYQLTVSRDKDVTDTIKKHPELDNPNSEAGQAMIKLLNENPYLAQLPNGFSKAAEFLKATRDAARVSELEGKIEQLNKEKDEAKAQLKAATSLAGAGSQTQPGARGFDDMKDEEQDRAVERMFSANGEFVHAS